MQLLFVVSALVAAAAAATAQEHPRFKYIEAPTRKKILNNIACQVVLEYTNYIIGYQDEERFLPYTSYSESDESDDVDLNSAETGAQFGGGGGSEYAGFGGGGFVRRPRGQAYRGVGRGNIHGSRNIRGGGSFGGAGAGFGVGVGFPRGAFSYGLNDGRGGDFRGAPIRGAGYSGGGRYGGGGGAEGRGFGRGTYFR